MLHQLKKVCLIFVLMCGSPSFSSHQQRLHSIEKRQTEINDTICSDVENKKDLKMRAVLIVDGRLYIISKTWLLYTIEQSLSNINLHGINLTNAAPRPMIKQWSDFNRHKAKFNRIRDKITMIYSTPTVNEANVTWVVMNVPNEVGIKYLISTDQLLSGFMYQTDSEKTVAPITGARYYTIEYAGGGGTLYFVNWIYAVGDNGTFRLQSDRRRPMFFRSENQSLVLGITEDDTKIIDGYQRLTGNDWPALNGFFIDTRIILFTPKQIYNFTAGIDEGWNVAVQTIDMSKFFICRAARVVTDPSFREVTTTDAFTHVTVQSKSQKWLILIAILIAIIILTTVGVIACLTSSKAKHRRRHHDNHRNRDHKRSTKKASENVAKKAKNSNQKASINGDSSSAVKANNSSHVNPDRSRGSTFIKH